MRLIKIVTGFIFGFLTATTALAGDITINDAYARSGSKAAKAGAAFMQIHNGMDSDDRLIGVSADDVAAVVELHTHRASTDGVMQMMKLEKGINIPSGETALLERGGDHVMLMGLKGPLEDGKNITVTLRFEHAGNITIDVPVDLSR